MLYVENPMTGRRRLNDLTVLAVESDFDIHYKWKVAKFWICLKGIHESVDEFEWAYGCSLGWVD